MAVRRLGGSLVAARRVALQVAAQQSPAVITPPSPLPELTSFELQRLPENDQPGLPRVGADLERSSAQDEATNGAMLAASPARARELIRPSCLVDVDAPFAPVPSSR